MRSDAKRDCADVTGPEWQWEWEWEWENNIPPRPVTLRTPALLEQTWTRAAEAYEAVYELRVPLAAHARRGTSPSPPEVVALSKATADLTFAMEPLLYGPRRRPPPR